MFPTRGAGGYGQQGGTQPPANPTLKALQDGQKLPGMGKLTVGAISKAHQATVDALSESLEARLSLQAQQAQAYACCIEAGDALRAAFGQVRSAIGQGAQCMVQSPPGSESFVEVTVGKEPEEGDFTLEVQKLASCDQAVVAGGTYLMDCEDPFFFDDTDDSDCNVTVGDETYTFYLRDLKTPKAFLAALKATGLVQARMIGCEEGAYQLSITSLQEGKKLTLDGPAWKDIFNLQSSTKTTAELGSRCLVDGIPVIRPGNCVKGAIPGVDFMLKAVSPQEFTFRVKPGCAQQAILEGLGAFATAYEQWLACIHEATHSGPNPLAPAEGGGPLYGAPGRSLEQAKDMVARACTTSCGGPQSKIKTLLTLGFGGLTGGDRFPFKFDPQHCQACLTTQGEEVQAFLQTFVDPKGPLGRVFESLLGGEGFFAFSKPGSLRTSLKGLEASQGRDVQKKQAQIEKAKSIQEKETQKMVKAQATLTKMKAQSDLMKNFMQSKNQDY